MNKTTTERRLAQPVEDRLRRTRDDLRGLAELLELHDAQGNQLPRSVGRRRRELEVAFAQVQAGFARLQGGASPEPAAAATLPKVERAAKVESIDRIAASLQKRLGQRVTAYLSGVKDPKMVGRWAKGTVKPREVAEHRLRAAYPAAELIAEAYGADTARAWFFGTNSRLGDEAPGYLLRHGEPPFRDLLPAARAFVEGELT